MTKLKGQTKEAERQLIKISLKNLKEGNVQTIHLKGCECVVCTYNYPNKEFIIELVRMDRSMPTGPIIPSD